ncbi:TIGR00374 family protein [Rhodococcus rhodnii]|uniref:Integral membrane protein n=2 Tax=Rhodococcus rhodnii TaxID=38312 RepID=R7WM09_9NOCA|nr:hypothetical protein Rrhod_2324 [Rhodococcus rhodnii LMG 5362]TXG89996.1 TIGR00374 family protein [Rhodococcus rhodnii]
MAPPRSTSPASDSSRPRRWLRITAALVLLGILTAEAVYLWPTLHESWRALTEIHWGWVGAAVVAQFVSLGAYGLLQQRLLGAGGVVVGRRRSTSVILAGTAMTLTLPAGQVFSTAFTYKQTRRWGATPVVASWQLAMSGVMAAASLAAIGAVGALAFGTRISPVALVLTLVAAIALFSALRYISRNPESMRTIGEAVLARWNRLRSNPPGTGSETWGAVLEQLDAVELRRRDGAAAFGWSAVNRVADLACLGFACWAVGAEPSFAGLLIAFTAAKAVGSIPLAPGGLGFVDGALIAALTAAGPTASGALAAVFVYRIVSFVLIALVGWLVFAVLFRSPHVGDSELADDHLDREYGQGPSPFPRRRRSGVAPDPDPDPV